MRAGWVGVVGIAMLPTSLVAATLERGPVQVTGVAIERFAGLLTIELGTAETVTMKLDAPQDVIDEATIEVEGDRLLIRDVRGSGNNTVVVTGEVKAIARGGGTATVVIGGDGGADVEPTEMRLTVPVGTELSIVGFTGTAQIPDLRSPLVLTVTSASVTAGKVGPADIAIQGSGTIDVAGVEGRLTMSIKGSGNISVASGQVTALEASLSGSGTIEFGGTADTAVVRGQGAGRIAIRKVAAPADIDVKGGIKVEIGSP